VYVQGDANAPMSRRPRDPMHKDGERPDDGLPGAQGMPPMPLCPCDPKQKDGERPDDRHRGARALPPMRNRRAPRVHCEQRKHKHDGMDQKGTDGKDTKEVEKDGEGPRGGADEQAGGMPDKEDGAEHPKRGSEEDKPPMPPKDGPGKKP
jgi:hypothetical protein